MGRVLLCHDKERFGSGAAARRSLRVVRRIGEHREGQGKPMRAYPCPDCKGWHLTSDMDRR